MEVRTNIFCTLEGHEEGHRLGNGYWFDLYLKVEMYLQKNPPSYVYITKSCTYNCKRNSTFIYLYLKQMWIKYMHYVEIELFQKEECNITFANLFDPLEGTYNYTIVATTWCLGNIHNIWRCVLLFLAFWHIVVRKCRIVTRETWHLWV